MKPPDQPRRAAKLRRPGFHTRFAASSPRRQGISALVGLLAVVAIWRGAWMLLDIYLLPGSPLLSALISIALGLVALFAAGMSLDDAM